MENPCINLDKRTKAYKDCIQQENYKTFEENFNKDNSIGAGDVIETITKATGIEKAVKWIAGEDCGCDKRKQKANKIRIKIATCPTEDQYKEVKKLLDSKPKRLTQEDQELVVNVHNHVFNTQYKITKCGSCYKGMLNKLSKMIELYS